MKNVIVLFTQKSINMKSTFFYTLTLVLTFTFTAFTSICAQTIKDDAKTAAQTQNVQTIKLKVGGITCSGDIKDIQKAVTKMDGVTNCKQVGKLSPTSVFEVTFNPAEISEKEIRKLIEVTPGCDNPNEKP